MSFFEKTTPEAILPVRGTKKSAGYDLFANESYDIMPGTRQLVKIGVTFNCKDDEYLAIVPRSGLAIKSGITVLNSPGTVDADYYPREIGVELYNTSTELFQVRPGDRIAQGIISHYDITTPDNVVERERTGGFGSTGV